ncbi:aminotransferase class III-fold pyridoxal phosphate-dependent enzyme [Kineosporia mesophila]|uniref:Aminotransferase class III-fold pyridoxal phosphate-dependent enzyme n=1 Tax=Kineosporia mesophila TaxID=566012 RepID=A0ABP6Z446_9ACTN|nr:aminotransferase class III-fold pyridoxal phosphate-dependent enzyme [Kineosporia mesophila]MCD5352660.1 aminotransferase class III-fold pyridoxal phosphate-dependent enzyme [Kineosporia mesophila]
MTGFLRPESLPLDQQLRARARQVLPGGVYGHMKADHTLPPSWPQFWERSHGPYGWDVDGNRYIDLMCAWGPMVLGYQDPVVEAAAAEQAARGDTISGPSARMVEFAELLTSVIPFADWAMFGKNGNDATSTAIRVARSATGRAKFLKATPAYHGANDWFTPNTTGVPAGERANIGYFAYNDIASLEASVAQHDGEIAAIILTPFQHDALVPQQLVDPAFARRARELATAQGAALIIDEVRSGLRLDLRGAWESIGVRPDMTAYSKAIANGHPIAAVVGSDSLREGASKIFVTGSFWYSAVPMAAGIATVKRAAELDLPAVLKASGERFKQGIEAQGAAAGLPVAITGPVQMPHLSFADDPEMKKVFAFTDAAVRRGVLLHPWHNMFLAAAHTDEVVDEALARIEGAFEELAGLGL